MINAQYMRVTGQQEHALISHCSTHPQAALMQRQTGLALDRMDALCA